MKLNLNTKIEGLNVVLVPYRQQHVANYNKWMESKELLDLTDSEHLTLDEEYKMQKRWMLDETMLIFIILDKSKYLFDENISPIERECKSMIGDINLFIDNDTNEGEINIMIADGNQRGKGFGQDALKLLIYYTKTFLPQIQTLVAKINDYNIKSIHLFERLGFEFYEKNEIFKQTCLKLKLNQADNGKSTSFCFKNIYLDLNYMLD